MSDPQLVPGGPGHVHSPEHGHANRPGVIERLRHVLRPHSHEAADKVDAAMEGSVEGMRALWISVAVLGGTALLQAAVVAVSGSVALLGDTLHNAADALTAVPLGIAFVVGRRPPTRRYTYGYGRTEDLRRLVAGVRLAWRIAHQPQITRHAHHVAQLTEEAISSDDALAAYLAETSTDGIQRPRTATVRRSGLPGLACRNAGQRGRVHQQGWEEDFPGLKAVPPDRSH